MKHMAAKLLPKPTGLRSCFLRRLAKAGKWRLWLCGELAVAGMHRPNVLVWLATLVMVWCIVPFARGATGTVVLSHTTNALWLKIDGDKDNDWWIECSTNLTTWITMTNFGTLLSGNETNAPWRFAGQPTNTVQFYRARQTGGLYDIGLLRTISLTFTQANWSNLMYLAWLYNQTHTVTSNVYCSVLALDNGATNLGVGARWRGNTSFTGGPGSTAPRKKSIAITVDYTVTNADLMNYENLNLNNAFGDETMMREAVYFTIMRNYAVCPAACLAKVYINGEYRGVYSHVQQQDGSLIREFFPSNDGDRFRAANMDGSAAFVYLGNTNISTYTPHYELKHTTVDTNTAWQRFINAIYVFNTLPTNNIRDTAEDVIAVDRWLWFLALENIFVDDDSYFNKGSDYILYYEPESGRVHPVEHDGNEALTPAMNLNAALSPLAGATNPQRPILYRLLNNAELRQRYLAHMRTVLEEWFNPTNAIALVEHFHRLSVSAIAADPYRGYANMSTYTNDLVALKTFITNRWLYLTVTNADLRPLPPKIVAVYAPKSNLLAGQIPFVTAKVEPNGTNGIHSVWLYHRGKSYGKFAYCQMFDDGAHGDGAAGDGIFGAPTTNYPAGTKVRFYVEARSANPARAAAFSPPRAEEQTYWYRVGLTTASNTPVVINEFMADNVSTIADPQGEYDDWIELHNITDEPVDMSGRYLTDDSTKPRKWQFPVGTVIPPDGYLLVWADEDDGDTPGLHASFKLSKSGEAIYLIDTDANLNGVLDYIVFGQQITDMAYGRSNENPDVWTFMTPTPGAPNR